MIKSGSGIILLMLIGIWGCSKANDNTITLDASGKHPAGWAVATIGGLHPVAYQANQSACDECHGSSTDSKVSGGISGVSCFSTSRSGMACHPNGPSGHPAGWSTPGSHGSAAKAAAPGIGYCTQCHGAGYTGGTGVSCMTCHTTAPHPAAPWRGTTASGTTHTTTNPVNAAECARCHLNNQRLTVPQTVPSGMTPDCFNNTLCHGVASGHPAGWSAPGSHGAAAKATPGASQGFASCTQCHGTDFVSGIGTSCKTCHTTAPHPIAADWRSVGTITHTNTDPNNALVCSACHNSSSPNLAAPNLARFANSPAGSFNGSSPDCFTASMCHGDVRKTSNCDACHSTATTIPFKSMAGATAVSDSKVGAHVKHLSAASQAPVYSSNIDCSECHTVPASPLASGTHRNGTNDVLFGTLAKTGSLTPVYTATTGTCANTYCHGNTLDKPATAVLSPVWNTPFLTGNAASDCTKCHGYPPSSHAAGITSTQCIGCHPHVNASGTGFTDVTKHINGSVEATGGHSFPYPGSSHKSSTSGCSSCHVLGTSSSVYPAATSTTPPDCKSCHKLSAATTIAQMSGCSDCHGDAATGRPSGSTFPNIKGRHSSPSEHATTCTTCHSGGGGGTVTHGNSNNVVKTAADVILNGTAAGMSIVRNASTGKVTCTGTCHSQTHSGYTW